MVLSSDCGPGSIHTEQKKSIRREDQQNEIYLTVSFFTALSLFARQFYTIWQNKYSGTLCHLLNSRPHLISFIRFQSCERHRHYPPRFKCKYYPFKCAGVYFPLIIYWFDMLEKHQPNGFWMRSSERVRCAMQIV